MPKPQETGIQEQLLQACQELNPQADEELLKSCAEFLHISSFSGGLKDQPNLQTKGGKRAKAQLLRLAGDLKKVRKHLDEMNIEARTALKNVQAGKAEAKRQANVGKTYPARYWEVPDLTKMEHFLEEYILLSCDTFDLFNDSPAPKGAPKKHQPKEVTKIIFHVFKVLTKKKATVIKTTDTHKVYGPVYNFGTKIFKILHIGASFEAQADAVLYPSDSPLWFIPLNSRSHIVQIGPFHVWRKSPS